MIKRWCGETVYYLLSTPPYGLPCVVDDWIIEKGLISTASFVFLIRSPHVGLVVRRAAGTRLPSERVSGAGGDVAAGPELHPFDRIPGMGPEVMRSMVLFARTKSNQEIVEGLASEVRFVRPSRQGSGLASLASSAGGNPGEGSPGANGDAMWARGKTVVFTGTLMR